MRLLRTTTILCLSLLWFTSACEDDTVASKHDKGISQISESDAVMMYNGQRNFRTHLSNKINGVNTQAQGQAIFQLSKDGNYISYKLILANIENVTMAHIHLINNPSANPPSGPPVVWLYPAGPPPQLVPGRTDGAFAEGTISSDQLVGLLAGKELSELLEAMENGLTYVNVHTSQYPAGEIRGDI